MKGHTEVISALKEILTNELTAINQYFLHSRMCKDWGYEKIAAKFYQESLDEMKHARDLIDRILFLEGSPDLKKLHPLSIGSSVQKQMENDLKLEERAISDLKKAIETCIKVSDFASKELLESILVNEEEHMEWIESQLNIIKDIGEKNYLAANLSSE